ncbi:MAG: isocitrate/isopropylmalate dehydrogenase family protein [bacterium]
MSYQITLIPGDGIGPEISQAARMVLEATGVSFDWEIALAGAEVMDQYGTPLPDAVLESIRKNKVALKGPITTPVGSGFRSVNVALRKELNLYACVRPCKTYPGVRSRYQDIDLVIVRENTEDLYAGIEFEQGKEDTLRLIQFISQTRGVNVGEDSGISLKNISVRATERIVHHAFRYARENNRRKVTIIHKANILKYSDGLFLKVGRQVGEQYPDIEVEDRIVDNICMQLVQKPNLYDVLVLPNLYGDIISDLGAGLVGGLGVAPGANIGDGVAVFEPTHGSAPKYKGMNKVNPMAMMLSGVMMLRYLKEQKAADRLEKAIAAVIRKGERVTYDLLPDLDITRAASTTEVAEAVIEELSSNT